MKPRVLVQKTLRLVVDASPLVMAIWSLSAIWDIPDTLHAEHQAVQERRIATLVQEERPRNMSARTPEAEPLLTPAEVATMFRVDPKTVTRWAKAGKLTSIRTLGGHRRYRETEVRALLAGIPQQRSE
jgi:excisionase family DNA binding protein